MTSTTRKLRNFNSSSPARRTSTTRTRPSTTANMSAPSLAPLIMKRPWLHRWMKPLANWYTNAAGYRQLGLRYAAPAAPAAILEDGWK